MAYPGSYRFLSLPCCLRPYSENIAPQTGKYFQKQFDLSAAVWLGQVRRTKEIELGKTGQIQCKKKLNHSMLSFVTINFRIKSVEL